jgi:myo-inositol 2-dehydrogenase/D-chiro-inositol 1-dehydrogenase
VGFERIRKRKNRKVVKKMLKVGAIGLGKMGLLHTMNCAHIEGVKVVAAADRSERELKKAKSLGVKSLYNDYTELLRDFGSSLDAVLISLPNFLHFESIQLALEAGVNVFVEKPLANTTKECSEIVKLVNKSGRKLMIGHCERFFDSIEKMKENVDKGYLGNLEAVTLESISSGPFSHGIIPKPVPEWWFDKEKVGGGVLIDIGYHLIDLFRFFAGDCRLLSSHLGYKYNLSIEDSAIAVIQSKDSLTKGIVNVGWYEQISFPQNDFRVILHGDYGNISTRDFEPSNIYAHAMKEAVKNLLRKIARKRIKPLAYANYLEGFTKELKHFFNCLENDLEPSVTAVDGLRTIEVIEEAYRLEEKKGRGV